MPSRLTLLKLAEEVIRQSRVPFSPLDFEKKIKERWRRKISDSTLQLLKQQLDQHEGLIAFQNQEYLPCKVVIEKVRHIPLDVSLGKSEIHEKKLFAGYRLVPFLAPDLKEEDITLLDPYGQEIPRQKKNVSLENVLPYYRYSGEAHFPENIDINEWVPGKSAVSLSVWDVDALFKDLHWKNGDALKIRLTSYENGIFQVELYNRSAKRLDSLRQRAFHIALEAELVRLCAQSEFCSEALEKQLLQLFYNINPAVLDVPAFSLPEFIGALDKVAVIGYEEGGPRFVPTHKTGMWQFAWESVPREPQGSRGSMDEILEDMGFPFNGAEFEAILNATLGVEKYQMVEVFDLLFGGREDRFFNGKQETAFYRRLRKLLNRIFQDSESPEPAMVVDLRDKAVQVKLRLIRILRFLEASEIHLTELPGETLDQIIDLDNFCTEILPKFQDKTKVPDLKTIRYVRLVLRIIFPELSRLEEDIYHRLGVY